MNKLLDKISLLFLLSIVGASSLFNSYMCFIVEQNYMRGYVYTFISILLFVLIYSLIGKRIK